MLEEIEEISGVGMGICNGRGELLAAVFTPGEEIREAVLQFIGSMAESQKMLGCHFFKIFLDGELEYVLLAQADGAEAYLAGRMAACQIRGVAGACRERLDEGAFLRDALLGSLPEADLLCRAKRLHIGNAQRVVFVIEAAGGLDEIAMETVRMMFAADSRDLVTELDGTTAALAKDVGRMKDGRELAELAEMIVDTLRAEALVNARVGYGGRAKSLRELSRSYEEARTALEVGGVFYAGRSAVSYGELGPAGLCEIFLREVFGENVPERFDEETAVTIRTFFANNLNISETARQLYVHRNTLVYRLERIERELGLDIRKFEDAMLFQIAWMVIAHLERQKAPIRKPQEKPI